MLRRTRPRRARHTRSVALKLWREAAQVRPYLIADLPEYPQSNRFGALRGSRVLEILMEPVRVAGKDRAGFFGVIADSEDIVERLVGEFVHSLRLER